MKIPLIAMFALLCVASLQATLELPNVFSDHMVLQRERPIPVWGRGEPGREVSVAFKSQKKTVEVGADGHWRVELEPLEASHRPAVLEVGDGEAAIAIRDVLVGEVWLGSGQSNMDWTVRRVKDADLEILAADFPRIRLYKVSHTTSDEPRFSDSAVWRVCSPESASDFSAVAYYFARDLHLALDVPVGIVAAAWGGTPAIAWTREGALERHPLLAEQAAEWRERLADYPQALARYEQELADFLEAKGMDADHGLSPRELNRLEGAPRRPLGPDSARRPASLANGMIAPVAPFALRGAVWYQGEADEGWEPSRYGERLRVMIEDWRQWWGIGDMPFGMVQLANFLAAKSEPSDDPWPRLRESQRRLAADLGNVGLAVAIDIGEANDIHPRNKQEVGRRLARWALADVYGLLELRGGPELERAQFDGGAVTLTFSQVGSGLRVIDGHQLGGFTLAGDDGVFRKAEAKIASKDAVSVTSEAVEAPRRVRYAWQNNPVEANLGNEERLPASPFEASR